MRLSRRMPALVAGAIVLVAGLSVRGLTDGAFAKYAGVALYAAFVYTVVAFIAPRAAPWLVGAIAIVVCTAIEFAQLTPVPAALSAHSTLARLALGATFNLPDLAWYVVGVALALGVHGLTRRARSTVAAPQR